jgi:putative ABC transport system substrate-binding protein
VVALVHQRRLPAIYTDLAYIKVGGVGFYRIDRLDLYRRAAGYIDRILRGEKSGECPSNSRRNIN